VGAAGVHPSENRVAADAAVVDPKRDGKAAAAEEEEAGVDAEVDPKSGGEAVAEEEEEAGVRAGGGVDPNEKTGALFPLPEEAITDYPRKKLKN